VAAGSNLQPKVRDGPTFTVYTELDSGAGEVDWVARRRNFDAATLRRARKEWTVAARTRGNDSHGKQYNPFMRQEQGQASILKTDRQSNPDNRSHSR
jgi:hypothetical protein